MNERQLTTQDFQALRNHRAAEDPRYCQIAERLRDLFWDSSCNEITTRFYQRLENEAIVHGEPVYRQIKQVASSAMNAREPCRYFAKAICARLRERGYLEDGSERTGL